MSDTRRWIGVCGASSATARAEDLAAAEEVGGLLARAGAVLVCGGRDGVMEAACRGASDAGGLSVGLLPGDSREAANAFVGVAIPTGLGELRNGLIVRSADAVIAIGGSWGTLSEIALALKAGKPVVGLGTWELPEPGVVVASSAGEAVALVLDG